MQDIVSSFIQIPASQLQSATVIDRSAVGSSIIFHRMFARLAEAGFVVKEYHDIRTFGELQQKVMGREGSASTEVKYTSIPDSTDFKEHGLGIDIVDLATMPVTQDFRENSFYQMNFSVKEIAHCILQSNPYASFSGLFAAKEAICKADNTYRKYPFNTLEIGWDIGGKPIFQDFSLSISHSQHLATAVAFRYHPHQDVSPLQTFSSVEGDNQQAWRRAVGIGLIISLIASLAALVLVYTK